MSRPDHRTCLLTQLFGPPLSSIQKHENFIKANAMPSRNFDAIDDECAGVDPDDHHAHHRKSGKEVNRLLDLLDSLNIEGGNLLNEH